jgi:hypothetical protein
MIRQEDAASWKTMDRDLYDTIHHAVKKALDEQPKKEDKNHIVEVTLMICVVWVLSSALDYFSYARWVNKFRYDIWYNVDSSQVKQFQDKPPSDCDFLKSPIGRKGCHYKKHVDVEESSADNGNQRSVIVYWSKEDGDY